MQDPGRGSFLNSGSHDQKNVCVSGDTFFLNCDVLLESKKRIVFVGVKTIQMSG